MDNSPTSGKKRSAKQPLKQLEEEVMSQTPVGGKSKVRKDQNQQDETSQKFFQSLKDIEVHLGPSLCGICDRDIGKSIKIKCLECINQPLNMCLECLRFGRISNDVPEHQPNHSYFVYDNLNFPLFTKDWTAKEELLLLQGIMKCGLGNWADIASKFVETKDMKECEEHYFCFYYKSKAESLPSEDDFILKNQKQLRPDGTPYISIDEDKNVQALRRVKEYQIKKQVEAEAEQREFQQQPILQQNDPNNQQQGRAGNKSQRNNAGTPDLHAIVGYMPKRKDFDQEYDNDADTLLADLEFYDDESENDIKLKNEVIEIYNARIDERIRRKNFVIERGLLDYKKNHRLEKSKTKEEKEIITSMKIFARFNTPEEHDRLVNSLIKERLLREVIEQLKFFKQKGLTSLDQIEKFIDLQKKKNTSNHNLSNQDRPKYDEVEKLLQNPRDFISSKNTQLLDATSLDKKYQKGQASRNLNSSPMMAEPRWEQLDNKEKNLCAEINLKPDDYLNLKQKIIEQQAKNKNITQALLNERGRDLKIVKEKIPLIFDFWVKSNMINSK